MMGIPMRAPSQASSQQQQQVPPMIPPNVALPDLTGIEALMAAGIRSSSDAAAQAALHWACKSGDADTVSRLLNDAQTRADPSFADSLSLRLAAAHGHTHVVDMIAQSGRVTGVAVAQSIVLASEYGQTDTVAHLLSLEVVQWHARNHARNAMKVAASNGHVEVLALLANDPNSVYGPAERDAAFVAAARNGCVEVVKYMLSSMGGSVDAEVDDDAALLGATERGQAGVVKVLLSYFKNNVRDGKRAFVTHNVAFGYACEKGFPDIIMLFLNRDLFVRCSFQHLCLALKNGHEEAVDLILTSGRMEILRQHIDFLLESGSNALAARKGITLVTKNAKRGDDGEVFSALETRKIESMLAILRRYRSRFPSGDCSIQ
ncbi:hypothetical protein HDU80_011361 [Chytriomyces hyalinus]|nr:hypothetical protein HDU80_011361 [Chytriomyces hyalinus]